MPNAHPSQPSKEASLETWLDYLGQIHTSAIDLGLERIRRVAKALNIPSKPKATVFTVAGTNGKGSTTKAISELCLQSGRRVGLYQSPHVYAFNERIQIDGAPAEDGSILKAIKAVDAARLEIGESLSFFETTTLAAFWVFMQQKCTVWVLEVGLGGRLDATNLIDCDVGVVTSIALDHADWLGSDLETIGFEKAGILRGGKPAVLGQDLTRSVANHAAQIGASILESGQDFVVQSAADHWVYSSPALTLKLPYPKLALQNVSLALTAVLASSVSIGADQAAAAMSSMTLPGRFEVREFEGRTLILDALHNPAGARFFTARMREWIASKARSETDQSLSFVFSMLADKDIEGVVGEIHRAYSEANWFVSPIRDPHVQGRAASLDALRAVFDGLEAALDGEGGFRGQVSYCGHLAEAFAQAAAQTPLGGTIVVCGSFHTLHEAQQPDER